MANQSDEIPPTRPHVIVVVTDDQGYGDLGCHGNPHIRTPNMDALHERSVRLTNFHVDPTCSPSRAAIMTGCYSHRVNVWHTIMGRNYLDLDRPTLAELFRNAGYRTAHFGKWHLGGHRLYRPIDRGFDEWLGQGDGGTGCMTDHWGNRRVDDVYLHNGKAERIRGYGPDVFFDAAIDYIRQESDQPFFVYLATYIPHDPNSIPDRSWADAYREDVPLRSAYFYSSIECADRNLGRLVGTLRELDLEKDTILLFMTDNGTAQGHHIWNAGMRGHKGSVYDGGHRVPCFVQWPNGGISGGHDVDGLTAHIDLLPTLTGLAGIESDAAREADGMSLAVPLRDPSRTVPSRTLIVESQRIRHPAKYRSFVVMRDAWRLVNGEELANVRDDPGQERSVAKDNPELVAELQSAYERYWHHVCIGDDGYARPTIDRDHDENPVVLSAEHLIPDSDYDLVWNQQHVLIGEPVWGHWPIFVAEAGNYQLECRRWPAELNVPIRGVPSGESVEVVGERSSAFLWDEEVTGTLYGAQNGGEATGLDVEAIRLRVDGTIRELTVGDADASVTCRLSLSVGPASIRADMIGPDGVSLGSVYYLSIAPLPIDT